jgi:hypothetical protein
MSHQQTKITGGDPPTIPVDQEVVDIIRVQQQWAREFMTAHGAPEGTDPRYLFLGIQNNRLGLRPYASATFHSRLGALTSMLTITDSVGRAVTAEREFRRYKKVTADGRRAAVDPSDLYDLLHMDHRADRVPPNGWCMLPPKQVCSKGNACLTCDKFVTDASHRDELQHQLAQTEALITRRQTQFTARHSEPMGEDNIWLAGRLSETRALSKVLVALDQIGVHDDGQLRGSVGR